MFVTFVLVGCAACTGRKTSVAEALAPSVTAAEENLRLAMAPDAAPPGVPALLPLEPTEARASPRKLTLKLRSTPSGAAASVDGKLVGVTPTVVDVAADNQAHEFTFVLAGHEPWKLRFAPSAAGVIHATMLATLTTDAGPGTPP